MQKNCVANIHLMQPPMLTNRIKLHVFYLKDQVKVKLRFLFRVYSNSILIQGKGT